jgi:hypothetical protein
VGLSGSLTFGVGKGLGCVGPFGVQPMPLRSLYGLASRLVEADSVWTKPECRKRPWGQAGDNSHVHQSVRAVRGWSCPRLVPTHSSFAHTPPRWRCRGPRTPAVQQQHIFFHPERGRTPAPPIPNVTEARFFRCAREHQARLVVGGAAGKSANLEFLEGESPSAVSCSIRTASISIARGGNEPSSAWT